MSTAVDAIVRVLVRFIATNFPLSLDAGATLWAIRKFGKEKYAGAHSAKLVFWESGKAPDGQPIGEWEKKGYLPVNCGGGTLDHHPHGDHAKQCTFTLLLRELGYEEDPRFAKLARYVLWDDTRSFARETEADKSIFPNVEETDFALARIFKDMQSGFEPTGDKERDLETMRAMAQKALSWLYAGLDCLLAKQDRFHRLGGMAYQTAKRFRVTCQSGKQRRIVVGRNDCDEFGPYARAQKDFRPDLVIQGRHLVAPPAGVTDLDSPDWPINVQIFGTNKSGLDMADLVLRLRMEEMKYGEITNTVPLEDLKKEGRVDIVPHWYYMPAKTVDGSSMILNGSLTHRDIPPTKIHLDRVKNIVLDWLASI